MTPAHDVEFNEYWLRPLLDLAENGPSPEVQLAAMAAAARFPLGLAGWRTISCSAWYVIGSQPPGSRVRRQALALAVRIPLRSVRDELRQMAGDPKDADRDEIIDALESVGDLSRSQELLARARNGDPELWRRLALAPLETSSLTPDALVRQAHGLDPDARFWLALALGRLGRFDALEEAFAPGASVPALFWGSPWGAYERIAAIRPIPERLHSTLLTMLGRLNEDRLSKDDGLAHALRLTVWATTGIADAEGSPLPSARPFGPIQAPEQLRSDQDVSSILCEHLATQRPSRDDGQIAWTIAETPTKELIVEVVKIVRLLNLASDQMRLLAILGQAADCQAGRAPTPFRGAGGGGVAPTILGSLIDDRTRHSARPPRPSPRQGPSAAGSAPDSPLEAMDFSFEFSDSGPLLTSRPAPGATPEGGPAPSAVPDTGERRRRRITIDTRHVEYHTASRSASSPPPPVQPEVPDTDERRVRAKIICAGLVRDTFVAGAENTIRCWIGLPEADGAASSDVWITTVAIPSKGLELTVELSWKGKGDSTTLLLPASRTARSGDCDLRIEVPNDERFVSAEVMFRYRGRCFESVLIEAAALAPGEVPGRRDVLRVRTQLSRREVIALEDAQPCSATVVFGQVREATTFGRSSLRVFDGTGGRDLALNTPEQAIQNLNGMLFLTAKSLVRRRAESDGKEAGLDVTDEEVRVLLRDMARFGTSLFNQLDQQGFRDPGDRFQFLSFDPDVVLPLEFVYDRGYPVDGAVLCNGWKTLPETDADVCPACGNAPLTPAQRRHAKTICPQGFWSLRKVIERLSPDSATNASAPSAGRRRLPAIDSAVFASSNRVPEDERDATWQTIREQFANATLASDWDEWCDAVRDHPRLLIALPHHDEEGIEDFLEIGDVSRGPDLTRLGRGQIRSDCVNPDGRQPGPILLLLGCETGAESKLGYVQMMREFQTLSTSIVLGTLSKILGRHAAPLARELVTELADVEDADADFGTLMRRVRRHMLGRGYLLALGLVALGDAEWRLTPRSQARALAAGPN